MNPTAASFDVQMKVAFHDLDPLQIVWRGNYMKYFDVARFGLFESVGIDLYQYMLKQNYVFPITRSDVKYVEPLRAFDIFVCKAWVTEARYKIVMKFEIQKDNGKTICARATSEQLAVRHPEMEMEFAIPDDIRIALGF